MTTSEFLVRAIGALEKSKPGVQVFLASDDVSRVHSRVCELGRTVEPGEVLPIYVLSGRETELHQRLFDPQERAEKGSLLPQDARIIVLLEHFDAVSRGMQRAYAHLVDGGDPQNSLFAGSILLLHVPVRGAHDVIEPGTLDRGIWWAVE